MSSPARHPPSLPAHDPAPALRQAALAEARHAYVYDFDYAGLCFVKDLPGAEHFPPPYLARSAKIGAQLTVNRAVATSASLTTPPSSGPFDPWRRMFPVLRSPLALQHWKEDWCFGWQRLAGPCPIVIRRVERLPACLPVGDEHIERARVQQGDSVSAALAEGRLFVADYTPFAGLRAGETDGMAKYLWAPVALFVAHPGGLAPVAIQIDGHAGTAATLVGPSEGARWMAARTVVQAMDESHQGVITHVGLCHMVIQRFILAARRCLAPWHPLHRLFAPHFENTLAVNQVARDSVVSPGGTQDRLLAPVLEDQLALLRRSVAEVDFASLDPTVELARRGVDDTASLPVYPFREDSLPLWKATRDFVAGYVALYYAGDADVAADAELSAFVAEIGAPDGGRLPAMMAGAAVTTVGDVIDLAARVVFRASTWHAAINDAGYEWVAFAPNMPSAAFAPFPGPGAAVTDDALVAMLPSVKLSWEIITATYQVAEIGENRLGCYDVDSFDDPRVPALVERFQAALRSIEEDTETRNIVRPVPYEMLLPSKVTASINA